MGTLRAFPILQGSNSIHHVGDVQRQNLPLVNQMWLKKGGNQKEKWQWLLGVNKLYSCNLILRILVKIKGEDP